MVIVSSRTKFKTNITAPVLKLLSNTVVTGVENPIINKEFKEAVIGKRRDMTAVPTDRSAHQSAASAEPTEVPKCEAPVQPQPVRTNPEKTAVPVSERPVIKEVTINIISELVRDLLPEAIARFRCCGCDACRAEMTIQALNSMTPKYVNIKTESDLKKLERIKEENKQYVIKALVPIVLKNKNNPIH